MKPEAFSVGPNDLSVSVRSLTGVNILKKDTSAQRDVGFRLCPCKVYNVHSHRVTGPWCDIPDAIFQCLPEDISCHNVGLCRFKTEVPGILQRIVSEEEVRFSLKRAMLVQRASCYMGNLHKNLYDEHAKRAFPRGVAV